jgi:hypothetical protein
MANHFPDIINAEQKNFEQSLKMLGETARIIDDLDALHDALGGTLKHPAKGSREEVRLVFHSTTRIATICQRELTMSALTLLRGHRSDALTHLRKAIDATGSIWRISRHPELAKVWAEAGSDKDPKQPNYRAYHKQFKGHLLYPKAGEADHNPQLSRLYSTYGIASKVIHVSIFGVAAHMGKSGGGQGVSWNFLDLSSGKDLVSTLFTILFSHLHILAVLDEALDGKAAGPKRNAWREKLFEVAERVERHRLLWVSRFP